MIDTTKLFHINLYIAQAKPGSNSWNVFEYGRLNEFGERFCHLAYVTLAEADTFIEHYKQTQKEIHGNTTTN
jgi:hypothetical protein